MPSLLARYEDKIAGVLSCYDRVVIYGTLPGLCHPAAMEAYLGSRHIRLFDFTKWAEPLRDAIREHAGRLARQHGVTVECIRKKGVRKEDRVAEVLAQRGHHPGLVHIVSAMEACDTYEPRYDKAQGKAYLKHRRSQCLHYYFYFIEEALGLCYLRVPTWAPFRLQFYFNGHNQLAAKLRAQGIGFRLSDNVFLAVEDFARAQALADGMNVRELHRALDRVADRYCPVVQKLDAGGYHWSIMECEYATDVIFKRQSDLQPIYDTLVRTAIHAVKPSHIATFLGHRLTNGYRDEVGNNFTTRIAGTCIRHRMGRVSIKMYDKLGVVLRIETTVNDVGFFKHHRQVEQRDGKKVFKLAAVRKTIYSLAPDLCSLLCAANRRYLEFLSDLDDPSAGIKLLRTLSEPVTDATGRSQRGFNLFLPEDETVLRALVQGEFTIGGLRHRDLRNRLPGYSPHQISSRIRRLRTHGLIRRIGRTYKYYITAFGRRVILAGLRLKELFIIPSLAAPATA